MAASKRLKIEILTIAVGSKNPCKIEAVKLAFTQAFPDATLVIEGYNVPSGVKDQPFGDEETITGAKNRAKSAAEAFSKENDGQCASFSVGLEGGVGPEVANDGYSCFAYMAVQSSLKPLNAGINPSVARTGAFTLPPQISSLMKQNGLELGDASDKIFSRNNSKHAEGTVGLLTGGAISRAEYYQHALALALAPFLLQNSWLYDTEGQ